MHLTGWIAEFFQHPIWTYYRLRLGAQKRLDRRAHNVRMPELEAFVCPIAEAVARVTNVPKDSVESLIATQMGRPPIAEGTGIPDSWAASATLTTIYIAICKIKEPDVVVETGVATGVSSSAILNLLCDLDHGELHSIECPPLGREDVSYVGASIPSNLRRKWHLHMGPSNMILPRLLKRIGPTDIFIHDSDHSYWSQKKEYEVALQFLKPDGVLISDDICNDSFLEVSAKYNLEPIIVRQRTKNSYVGILSNLVPRVSRT